MTANDYRFVIGSTMLGEEHALGVTCFKAPAGNSTAEIYSVLGKIMLRVKPPDAYALFDNQLQTAVPLSEALLQGMIAGPFLNEVSFYGIPWSGTITNPTTRRALQRGHLM